MTMPHRGCQDLHRFQSGASARKAVRVRRYRLRAYLCDRCGGWHVQPRKGRRRRR